MPFRDFSITESKEIAELAETENWQTAAHDHMRSLNHRTYRLAVDEYGAQLRFLLPINTDSRVLVLQSGWGPIAFNLATFAGSVIAADSRQEQLRFIIARGKQTNLRHLHATQHDLSTNLPYARDTFNVVILVGFQQEGDTSDGLISRDGPDNLLREMRRVLQPGGSLMVSAPNRIGIMRQGDLHALPERSFWGHRSALEQAGFVQIQFHMPVPSNLEPFFIIPLDKKAPLEHFMDHLFNSQDYRKKLQERGLEAAYSLTKTIWGIVKLIRISKLAPYVAPSYLLVASK